MPPCTFVHWTIAQLKAIHSFASAFRGQPYITLEVETPPTIHTQNLSPIILSPQCVRNIWMPNISKNPYKNEEQPQQFQKQNSPNETQTQRNNLQIFSAEFARHRKFLPRRPVATFCVHGDHWRMVTHLTLKVDAERQ